MQGPETSAFLINVHEPIIWRLYEMIQQVNVNRLHDPKTKAVSIDPIIQIGYDHYTLRCNFTLTLLFPDTYDLW